MRPRFALRRRWRDLLQLEAALNSFQSKAEEVSEFARGAAAALEQSAPGADIDGIEQQLAHAAHEVWRRLRLVLDGAELASSGTGTRGPDVHARLITEFLPRKICTLKESSYSKLWLSVSNKP